MNPKICIMGIPISGLKRDEFIAAARDAMRSGKKVLFTTVNAHSMVQAQKRPDFFAHFQQADFVLPDGILPVWAGRLLGFDIPERVAGTDFTQPFLAMAERENFSVFFLGATQTTLDKIRAICKIKYPSLVISGCIAPPFGEWDEETDRRIIASINSSSPDALFVGMTAPKQELWLSKNCEKLNVKFMMGVGAVFDYLAGTKKRAPYWLGQIGLEWLPRLIREPRRLWRRNLDSVVFIYLFFKLHGKQLFLR